MKNFKHYLIKKLLKWSKVLDIEKALRDKYREGCAATEKKYANRVNVWYDPTVRSYPQQEPKSAVYEPPQQRTDPLHLPPGTLARGWHAVEVTGVHPTISQALKRIRMEPVRTNTAPIDPKTDFPKWLTGEDDPTLEVPAIKKQAYQEYHKRHAS